ncbi:histone-lysine N-methyltransferase SETMAR [Trichonephila clavipes]|nr:histone-lysine N-methyltransferase SETMAR [Trichonephila clavipes]
MESDKQHFRHILLFYYRKGKSAVQARKKLTDVYGEGELTVRQSQNWFAKFRSGNFDVEEAPRSRRPVEADKDAIKTLVDANRRITTRESLLKRHKNDPFLKSIITGDEKGHGAKKMNRLKPFPKPIFTKKSDEAHFWLNGYVNKQNCRIRSEANPQVYVETPLHPEKLTVWCALWAGGIIGPYFFKNDESHNVTVNGDRYRAMITNFFIPELNNHGVQSCGSNKTAQHVTQLVPQSIY